MRGERFRIAQVTPYPWETGHDVNRFVEAAADELKRAGHEVVIVAPSGSRRLVREGRARVRGLEEGDQGALFAGEVLAVGQALPFGGSAPLPIDVSRTLEMLMGDAELDFVHVHEPFAPSVSATALRHSRALNVATFHSPSERFLSTQVRRKRVGRLLGRLDARTALSEATRDVVGRFFPGAYELLPSGDGTVGELGAIYARVAARRHDAEGDPEIRRRLAEHDYVHVDLHMHTDHSGDCATPVATLIETAKAVGLDAIAITDHNEVSGAHEARDLAEKVGGIEVIVAEEVKTADQGEVIGLFIEEKIPRGLTLQETIAAIREQGGLVYVPHPFDRMHSVPDYEHMLDIVEDIDAIEVFNPRVAFSAFNEEAARFAEKYRVVAGAGSDSHVAAGLGSVKIKMRAFDGPAEFLESLRDADIVRKRQSLLYVQALKFIQTKATPEAARRRTARPCAGARRTVGDAGTARRRRAR
ncbi:MAG: glycosyltransferase [Thermoleophilaceae bacterium]